MLAEDWYRSLARVNRLIVRVRDRIENLTVHISELERRAEHRQRNRTSPSV